MITSILPGPGALAWSDSWKQLYVGLSSIGAFGGLFVIVYLLNLAGWLTLLTISRVHGDRFSFESSAFVGGPVDFKRSIGNGPDGFVPVEAIAES
jgi:hypothetical protein